METGTSVEEIQTGTSVEEIQTAFDSLMLKVFNSLDERDKYLIKTDSTEYSREQLIQNDQFIKQQVQGILEAFTNCETNINSLVGSTHSKAFQESEIQRLQQRHSQQCQTILELESKLQTISEEIDSQLEKILE